MLLLHAIKMSARARASSKLVALKKTCIIYLFIVGVLVVGVHVLGEYILGIDAEDRGYLGVGATAQRFRSVDGLGCSGGALGGFLGYPCGRRYPCGRGYAFGRLCP